MGCSECWGSEGDSRSLLLQGLEPLA